MKCEKCLNSIRAYVLRENADANRKRSKGKESCLSPLDNYTSWSVQIGIEAKKLANDPAWCCDHSPDETYFVRAIRRGVKNLLKNSKVNIIFFNDFSVDINFFF